jgi:enoyl-CoA hydratase/carnithine racemase
MGQYSKTEVDGHLFIITINRPEVMNAIHYMASEELSAAFDEFANNPELWVAIVTGAGDRAFFAGNDLKFHAEYQAKHGKRPPHISTGFGGITNRHDLDKPVIAAVNGVAMAAASRSRSPATSSSPPTRRGSRCPSRASASPRPPVACSAFPAKCRSRRQWA